MNRADVIDRCAGVGAVDASMHDLSDAKSSGRPRGRRLATQQWCIAKPNLENANYQGALDWVCGPLSGQGQVNCGPLQASQSCFLPNTYQAHASWAFNAYYQTHGQTSQACDFQGTATITTTDPSMTPRSISTQSPLSVNAMFDDSLERKEYTFMCICCLFVQALRLVYILVPMGKLFRHRLTVTSSLPSSLHKHSPCIANGIP